MIPPGILSRDSFRFAPPLVRVLFGSGMRHRMAGERALDARDPRPRDPEAIRAMLGRAWAGDPVAA